MPKEGDKDSINSEPNKSNNDPPSQRPPPTPPDGGYSKGTEHDFGTNSGAGKTKCIKRKCSPFEIFGLIVNVLIMLITGIGVWIFKGQLDEMRKATEAATEATRATLQGIAETGTFNRVNERAWLAYEVNLPVDIENPILHIPIKNYGNTFARVLKSSARCLRSQNRRATPDHRHRRSSDLSCGLSLQRLSILGGVAGDAV